MKISIRSKIFAAFVGMGLITGTLGAYGLYMLAAAGDIVADTYDRPLMAINYARSASLTFAQMDKEALRRKLVPAAERAGIDRSIATLTTSFLEDLGVAEQRSLGDDEVAIIQEIKQLVEQWSDDRRTGRVEDLDQELEHLAERIIERFDQLIELTVGHSFVERRKAVSAISQFEYASIVALVFALVFSAAISLVLASRIIRPLSAAASIADRIAGGELQTPIPAGGADETGILLRSMTVMRDNIRAMMEREVTQRRSAQSHLIDALESSREGMMLVDAAGRIVVANSQLASFFPPAASHLVGGADFAAAFRIMRPLLMRSETVDEAMLAGRRDGQAPGGELQLVDGRWIRFSRSTTQDGGFILFLSDFTEIKEREARLREAKHQAEAASTAKSNFLANMSHELRTPLNAIIGFSEIIAEEIFGAVGRPQYVEYASDILHSGRHLLDVINGVLDLAKSEAGKQQIHAETLDLRSILDDCIAMLRDQCARGGLKLVVIRAEAALPVRGENAKLRQTFLNLLSNAVKFTEPGGSITVCTEPPATDRVLVRICDTGIGMSADDIVTALDPFGQVDSRLARRYQGTGLGLSLAKSLVELHGGSLTIESESGRGTIVTVALALAGAADHSIPAEAAA